MFENIEMLTNQVQLELLLSKVIETGYAFIDKGISMAFCKAMENEVNHLSLEEGDHINYPINAGTLREVKQLHIRSYHPIGSDMVPMASLVSNLFAKKINILHPELNNWMPTEAGYQRYRDDKDWISPHRDRRNDKLLSITITINGSAEVKVYVPLDDPDDYTRLKLKDSFLTNPGTIMFLRAPGLGNGEQIIHEVCPPKNGSRLILNLRMRDNLLKTPEEFTKMRKI